MDDIFSLVDIVEQSNYDVLLYGPETEMDEMFDPERYASFQRMYLEQEAKIHFDFSDRPRPVLLLNSTMRTLLKKDELHMTLEILTNYMLKNNCCVLNLFRSNIDCEKYAVIDQVNNLTLGLQPVMTNWYAAIMNPKSKDDRILNVDPNIFSFDPKYASNEKMLYLNNVCKIPEKVTSTLPIWKDFGFWIICIIILALIIGGTFFLAFSYFTRQRK